jgi:hypothetical protein
LAHDAVRVICSALAKSDTLPDIAEIHVQVAAACAIPELAEHGNAAGFQQLVLDLVLRFVRRATAPPQAIEVIETSVAGQHGSGAGRRSTHVSQGTILRLVQSSHHSDDNVDAIATRALDCLRGRERARVLNFSISRTRSVPQTLSLKKGEVKGSTPN